MKGRKIDLATANDALILDTFDLMATYGCARDTIRVRMRKGIIPPPLDRVGGRFRWTCASGTFCEQNEPLKPCLK